MISYNIYPSLLDAFQDYLDYYKSWKMFYGKYDYPKVSEDEYERRKWQSLMDRINRVPFESEAADRGTAFNEVVDCLVENRKTDKMKVERVYGEEKKVIALLVAYKNHLFRFPIGLCREFEEYFKGAIPQMYIESILPTRYGDVKLYGYLDYLLPSSVHDLKTTGKYVAYKFRDHWQHRVYPYCLRQMGNDISMFEYDVTDFNDTYKEVYEFKEERDIPDLEEHCERFIEFLIQNKENITDKKVFGGVNE